jgi:hypothetical protein
MPPDPTPAAKPDENAKALNAAVKQLTTEKEGLLRQIGIKTARIAVIDQQLAALQPA